MFPNTIIGDCNINGDDTFDNNTYNSKALLCWTVILMVMSLLLITLPILKALLYWTVILMVMTDLVIMI